MQHWQGEIQSIVIIHCSDRVTISPLSYSLELNSAGSWLFKGTPPHRNNEEEFQMHAQNLLALASVLALTVLLAACGATTKMIMIKSSPDEAEVSIAGKVVGSTPVEQYKLEFK
mgnify:CR=1 FL=1